MAIFILISERENSDSNYFADSCYLAGYGIDLSKIYKGADMILADVFEEIRNSLPIQTVARFYGINNKKRTPKQEVMKYDKNYSFPSGDQ